MPDPFQLSALRFLELGDKLRRHNRLLEARQAYASALESDPACDGAWLGLGLAAEGLGDTAAAHAAFARACERLPGRIEAHLGLASACQALGRNFDAIQAWLKAWALKPDDLRIYNILWQGLNEIGGEGAGYAGAIARGNDFRAKGMVAEALAAYRQARDERPDLPFAHSREGCLLARAQDIAGAEAAFAKARDLAGWVETGIRLAPGFFEGQEAYRSNLEILCLAPGSGPLAMVGCDCGYFKRYAAGLWESLVRCEGETASLHVHLIHPDAASLEIAKDLGLGVSVEHPDLGGCSRNFVNTYYASARFLALPGLLEAYCRPLLVMDIDARALRSLAPLWTILKDSDMAIRRLQGATIDPWNEPQANLVGVNPTGLGSAFTASMSRYLAHFVARKQLFGFFDQTALYSVLKADPSLSPLKQGVFPDYAYGYPLNKGAAAVDLVYPNDLIVGEVKTPSA